MICTLIKNDYILIEPFLLTSLSRREDGAAARDVGWDRVPLQGRASSRPGPQSGADLEVGAGGEVLGVFAHSGFELLL